MKTFSGLLYSKRWLWDAERCASRSTVVRCRKWNFSPLPQWDRADRNKARSGTEMLRSSWNEPTRLWQATTKELINEDLPHQRTLNTLERSSNFCSVRTRRNPAFCKMFAHFFLASIWLVTFLTFLFPPYFWLAHSTWPLAGSTLTIMKRQSFFPKRNHGNSPAPELMRGVTCDFAIFIRYRPTNRIKIWSKCLDHRL